MTHGLGSHSSLPSCIGIGSALWHDFCGYALPIVWGAYCLHGVEKALDSVHGHFKVLRWWVRSGGHAGDDFCSRCHDIVQKKSELCVNLYWGVRPHGMIQGRCWCVLFMSIMCLVCGGVTLGDVCIGAINSDLIHNMCLSWGLLGGGLWVETPPAVYICCC
jgi:hypothetical protein